MVGDNYYVQRAGAVGPGAHAENTQFIEVSDSFKQIDLRNLREDLTRLRAELNRLATAPGELETAAAIGRAEESARSGDRAGVLSALSSAGHWALEVSEKIVASVAAEALKQTLGM